MGKFTYSLLTEPWIDVVTLKGEPQSVGLIELFEKAHLFEKFDFSMPGHDLAVLRFLVALVYIVSPPKTLEEWKSMIETKKFDPSFISGLKKHEDRLDLFHDKYPFMQEAGLKKLDEKDHEKNAKLNRSLPTAGGHLHFHHIERGNICLCNKCTIVMLLFEQLFACGGGRGYEASINGHPPYYVSCVGNNIFETIIFNTPYSQSIEEFINISLRKQEWSKDFKGEVRSNEINLQEGLMWKSRQILLFPTLIIEGGFCYSCNDKISTGIKSIIMKSQKASVKKEDIWIDPFISLYETPIVKNQKRANNNQMCVWRDYTSLIFDKGIQTSDYFSAPPLVIQQIKNINNQKPKIKIHAYFGEQASVYQIKEDIFSYNPGFDDEDIITLKEIVSLTEKGERALLESILKILYGKLEDENDKLIKIGKKKETYDELIQSALKGTDPPNENALKKKIKQDCRLIMPKYWNYLENDFHHVLNQLEEKSDPEDTKQYWKTELKKVIIKCFNETTVSFLNKSNYLKYIEDGKNVLEQFIHFNLKSKEVINNAKRI